jgi:hypothetical protein
VEEPLGVPPPLVPPAPVEVVVEEDVAGVEDPAAVPVQDEVTTAEGVAAGVGVGELWAEDALGADEVGAAAVEQLVDVVEVPVVPAAGGA